jgi:hypothetical protein
MIYHLELEGRKFSVEIILPDGMEASQIQATPTQKSPWETTVSFKVHEHKWTMVGASERNYVIYSCPCGQSRTQPKVLQEKCMISKIGEPRDYGNSEFQMFECKTHHDLVTKMVWSSASRESYPPPEKCSKVQGVLQ